MVKVNSQYAEIEINSLKPASGPEVFPQGDLRSVVMSCLCKQNPGTWSERLRVSQFPALGNRGGNPEYTSEC